MLLFTNGSKAVRIAQNSAKKERSPKREHNQEEVRVH